jgi:hypothetical protein
LPVERQRGREVVDVGAVGVHDVDVEVAVEVGGEGDAAPVGGPGGRAVVVLRRGRDPGQSGAVVEHGVDVVVEGLGETAAGRVAIGVEGDVGAVGRPGRPEDGDGGAGGIVRHDHSRAGAVGRHAVERGAAVAIGDEGDGPAVGRHRRVVVGDVVVGELDHGVPARAQGVDLQVTVAVGLEHDGVVVRWRRRGGDGHETEREGYGGGEDEGRDAACHWSFLLA